MCTESLVLGQIKKKTAKKDSNLSYAIYARQNPLQPPYRLDQSDILAVQMLDIELISLNWKGY